MDGKRVLVTGLGGELGSRVGAMLEDEPWVGSIAGFDANPPRRRLKRAAFHLVAADDRDAVVRMVSDVDPHVVVHLGVWEPHARLSTDDARSATEGSNTHMVRCSPSMAGVPWPLLPYSDCFCCFHDSGF